MRNRIGLAALAILVLSTFWSTQARAQECTFDIDCDDANVCTDDRCLDGLCANRPLPGQLCGSGGNLCDGLPTCDETGACVTEPVDCNDANGCTIDFCDPFAGCVFDPIPGCGQGVPVGSTWFRVLFTLALVAAASLALWSQRARRSPEP